MKRANILSPAFVVLLSAVPVLFPVPASAWRPGFPGAVWGSLSRGFDDTEGTGVQGWARQGVRWAGSPGGLSLNTYAVYNWRVRTLNKEYFNISGPSLLAALEKGSYSAGAEFAWLRYPELPLNTRNYSLFAGWFVSRDISKWTGLPSFGANIPIALPFAAWGKLTYDLQGEEGSGSQGWARQGVDWLALGRGWKFNTYAAYNWRLRSKNKQYYNVFGPSLGAVFKGRYFDVGAEYCWQRFPELGRSARTFNVSLGWYFSWDLGKK